MSNSFPQIRAAAIDERAHNVFYRLTQLERLCKTLIDSALTLQEAITADYGHSQAEVSMELNLTISAVKRDYSLLQPKMILDEEYSIAYGKDAPLHRKAAGIVYIEPTTHTLLYSAIIPLSAAIAAGNCVILLLENNIRAVSTLLRQILPVALDQDTFAIASTPIKERTFLNSIFVVDQNRSERWPKANQLFASSHQRTIAVVDRTADVKLAARELVFARFSFGGTSPYGPDIVLVNEFVKQSFVEAVVSECVKLDVLTMRDNHGERKSASTARTEEKMRSLQKADPELSVVLHDGKHAVVDLRTRQRDIIAQVSAAPILISHTMRSLDDAIDLIGSTSDGAALAAFYFGSRASAKYLSQFVDANISFVNHVPREILLGPAFPASHAPIYPNVRYPIEIFTIPRPVFIQLSEHSKKLDIALASANNRTAQKLFAEATAPLAVVPRSKGGSLGFFEQGFLINAGLILTTAASMTGMGVYWLVRSKWLRK